MLTVRAKRIKAPAIRLEYYENDGGVCMHVEMRGRREEEIALRAAEVRRGKSSRALLFLF